MTRILLIEDDATIADGIVKGLSQQNMMVDWFADAKLGEMAIHEGVFDAVLLIWPYRVAMGWPFLANWRQQKIDTPVLIITGTRCHCQPRGRSQCWRRRLFGQTVCLRWSGCPFAGFDSP